MKLSQIVQIASHPQGTLIHTTSNAILVPMSLKRTLNELCLVHGSSLAGRLAFARRITGKQRMLPLYVSARCLLLPTGSIKSYETIFHNWYFLSTTTPVRMPHSMLQAATEIAEKQRGDYDILDVLKGSHIHE